MGKMHEHISRKNFCNYNICCVKQDGNNFKNTHMLIPHPFSHKLFLVVHSIHIYYLLIYILMFVFVIRIHIILIYFLIYILFLHYQNQA